MGFSEFLINKFFFQAFLMRCLGYTLSRITNTSFIIDHALLMFRSTTHSNQIERVGCAMAMGHCAQSHTDMMLTELENVAKWEHTKKSGAGFFSIIKVCVEGLWQEITNIILIIKIFF